ncbi:MAG: hypothetical protein M3464_22325 [Chloroflexota bacterium]|nr:hypothetical protein [Chloroflexota bacterium]
MPYSDGLDNRRQRVARLPRQVFALIVIFALIVVTTTAGGAVAWQDVDSRIQVIARGVAEVPAGDVVWRTVRAQAEQAADEPYSVRPLGFVIAANGPLLLADDSLRQLIRLFPGEAAFVAPGVIQQRSSLSDAPVTYLAVELVPAAEAANATGATVLQPGQPFPSPGGFRDFDLVTGSLTSADAYTVPDTGQKNIILVTDGAVAVGRDGSAATTLIAGESATFSGELQVAGTEADSRGVFVVAIIGDEVTPPAPPAGEPVVTSETVETPSTPEAPVAAAGGTGSITVQAWLCPPGMTEETLIPDQCEPTASEFEATLAGGDLPAPLVLADATAEDGTYRWSDLAFGDYRLAEVVLPEAYETYILRGARATGDASTGYTITLSAETPDLEIQLFNFVPR